MSISTVEGFYHPIASRKPRVNDMRPDASTIRSAARAPTFPERPRTERPWRGCCRGRRSPRRRARDFDTRLLFEPVAADALKRRARQSELVVSKIALRKRIEAGQLQPHIAAKPYPDRAGAHEIGLEPGKQTIERECPPASSACVRRDCGVPEGGAGASGKESRSNTVTFSK